MHEFHDDEDVVEIVHALWSNNVEDLGGVVVVLHLGELSQDLDFTYYLLGVILVFEYVIDEFDSNFLTGFSMFSLNNFTVAADSDELDEFVVLEGVSPDRGEGDHVGLGGGWAST